MGRFMSNSEGLMTDYDDVENNDEYMMSPANCNCKTIYNNDNLIC